MVIVEPSIGQIISNLAKITVMKNEKIVTFIVWIKRLITVGALVLWGFVIWSISKSAAPFTQQAPYCMVSTMLTFSLLSLAYRGLDHWAKHQK